jgi:hypothetical protein
MEVCPMLIGEQSPVKVGHDMQTTIPGLFAIGDVSYCGSAAPGAVPAPPGRNRGSGILNAVFAGILCADGAAAAGASKQPDIDAGQVKLSAERIYAPLERADGTAAKDVIREVQRAVGPMENSVYMSGERIEKALEHVNKALEMAKTLKAPDFHGLLSCHEAEAMALCAQMQFLASQMRQESRGWFLREDYPDMDNKNWLKWIIIKNADGEMVFETEDVPYEKWPVKPSFAPKKEKGMPVPVTEEEKLSPLYKYFEMEMTPPAPEKFACAEEPMPSEMAQTPQEMDRMFDDGYLPGRPGFAQLPDGTAMLSNVIEMPGVTPEMFDWWFAWHGLEPLRYKIWDRDEHYYCQTRNPEKARDTSLSMKERYWDTVHDVKEAMYPDGPVMDIMINFRNPADIGFSKEKLGDFGGTIVCAGNEHAPVIMCHFVRPVPGGSELNTRFWMGYCVKDGKPAKAVPDGVVFPLQGVQALLRHNIKEFTNLAAILPKVYAEFHDKF